MIGVPLAAIKHNPFVGAEPADQKKFEFAAMLVVPADPMAAVHAVPC